MSAETYLHKEAFALMQYRCKNCGGLEVIWNSRDGVTPFGITSRCCKTEATHIHWQLDRCVPDFQPQPGQRLFRDGSPLEAEEIMRNRIAFFRNAGHDISPSMEESLLASAHSTDEFPYGWPHLVEVAT